MAGRLDRARVRALYCEVVSRADVAHDGKLEWGGGREVYGVCALLSFMGKCAELRNPKELLSRHWSALLPEASVPQQLGFNF